MDAAGRSENETQSSNLYWPSLCSSCDAVVQSIFSIGEPSFLGELFEESFNHNGHTESPLPDKKLVTEVPSAKDAVINIQNPEVTTTAANLERNGIVVTENIKIPALKGTNSLDEGNEKVANTKAGKKRPNFNYNMEDLANNRNSEGSSNCKYPRLDTNDAIPQVSHVSGNENNFDISNIIQSQMSNDESKRMIEEFRRECNEILNPIEINTLPSIEQYKKIDSETRDRLLNSGTFRNPSVNKIHKKTDVSVGAILLSTFTNAEKRSILDRRRKILLIVNRLINLTGIFQELYK